MDTAITFVGLLGCGFLLGVLITKWRAEEVVSYQTPNLHEGRWVGPMLAGAGDQVRVMWEAAGGYRICTGTNHGPTRCTIGPGLSHIDECMCGATRSGVHGAWLP